ncbi:MAG: hypothetical protein PHX30_03550 [Candidatus Pacebacteria bacterium]|nr:hypothetical protein [Candidatus Paceibacterota bacterium]
MDIKKINFNFKLSDIKITDEIKKKIFGTLERNLRLILLVFVGVTTIYSFNIIFKKAYVEIVYIQYPGYKNTIIEGKDKTMLEEIIQVIGDRKENLANSENKLYADPFSFRENVSPQPIVAVEGEDEDVPEVITGTDGEDKTEITNKTNSTAVDRESKSVLVEEKEQ